MAKRKPGRPRSEAAREAVLAAAGSLLDAHGGERLTIEGIARNAGVGKPTIYRWWPTLADVVLEALLLQADARISVPEAVPFADALRAFLRQSMEAINAGGGTHLRFLMAQAQGDEAFRERFRTQFVARRREVLLGILRRSGALEGTELPLLADVVFGAMWFRLLVGHAPMDNSFADELTAVVLRAV